MFKKLFFITLILLSIPLSAAHYIESTHTTININNQKIKVEYNLPISEFLKVAPIKEDNFFEIDPEYLYSYIEDGLAISNNEKPCKQTIHDSKDLEDLSMYAYYIEFKCNEKLSELKFSYDMFFNISENHENTLDIHINEKDEEIILSTNSRSFTTNIKGNQILNNIKIAFILIGLIGILWFSTKKKSFYAK